MNKSYKKNNNFNKKESVSLIKFCDRYCINVKSDNDKQYLLDKIFNKYGIVVNKNNYLFYNKSNKNIEKNAYILSIVSTGSPYILFLTRDRNTRKNRCYLIDCKIANGHKFPKILIVQYRFSERLYNDTIFHGELVKDNNKKWLYLINDIYVNSENS